MYLRETTSWRWEEGEEEGGEKVSLKTHANARGVGINATTKKFLKFLREKISPILKNAASSRVVQFRLG